ncbi:MAG: QueT transporter family protein [Ruminococcus sp.]|nr:QueT transporter family protein [Ruminococcus sp.]
MKNNKVLFISQGAIIAALYVALTHISNMAGLASGAVQIRLSEALTILPVFTPAAIPGLFIGCLISNLTTGCIPWDIVGGSMATLIGALGTYALRNHSYAAPVPPILANMIIVPFVLAYAYQFEGTIPYFMLTVGIGEVICCGIMGMLLMTALKRHSRSINWAH